MSDSVTFRSIDIGSLPQHLDLAAAEQRWRQRWQEWGVYAFDPGAPRSEVFSIDSPPPTVSGSLHVGHVFSYTHQDLIARYKRMRGLKVFYPMGWDDNGLPTERRVQNHFDVRTEPGVPYVKDLDVAAERERLGLKKKKRPLIVSRANFIELCHQVTAEDEVAFKTLFQRMGYSIDWSHEYATIDDRSRRIAQLSFLDLFEQGAVYSVEGPTMWDVDFQTAVAQAEVEDREAEGAFHDIEFGLEGGGGFTIATTRPELLPACVGIAAHPDDERYKHLIGTHAVTPAFFARVPIFASELVEPDKGTGILMVCTFGDQTDVIWWRENELEIRQVIGRDGRIVPRTFVGPGGGPEGWGSLDPERANANYQTFQGKSIKAARALVAEMLTDPANSAAGGERAPLRGAPKPIARAVRYYEKGDRPLEYLTTRQWFVRITDKKDRLIEAGRKIDWHPDFMRKRYENWVEGLSIDWCISRQRYFGVPFPVWYPLDEHGEPLLDRPIVATPDMLPVDPMTTPPPGHDESNRSRPGGFVGESDVFDTWFTSSMSPQIAARWGAPDDRMESIFPMDLRPQSHEIIRTWAFYTIVKSLLHHDDVPWSSIAVSGWILDPDRKKMSKSKGNVVTPLPLIDKEGADAVRYWAANARLGVDTAFDQNSFKVGRRLTTKLYNASKFVLSQTADSGPITRELDRAFVAQLRELVENATGRFEELDFAHSLQLVERFFWNGFTDNYLELVKVRARSEDDPAGRTSAVAGLRLGLDVLLRLFAPTLPMITEEVWSWVFAEETGQRSIHAAAWPTAAELEGVEAPRFESSFELVCEAIGAVRRAKSERNIRIGGGLEQLELSVAAADTAALDAVRSDLEAASGGAVTFVERSGDPEAGERVSVLTMEPA